MSRVFIIDDNKDHGDFYVRLLENNGFDVFATENAFEFVRYAAELQPDLYVINSNLTYTDYNGLMSHLINNGFGETAPLTVIYNDGGQIGQHGISHYLHERYDFDRLPEIAGAYGYGGNRYDVLLLDDYPAHGVAKKDEIRESGVSFFDVYDLQAAQRFLSKNTIRTAVVCCMPEKYDSLKNALGVENTFYVENIANFNDLVAVIQ